MRVPFFIRWGFLFLFVFMAWPTQAEEQAPTLKECYRLALKESETIAIQTKVIEEAEGRFLQSLSGIMPDVSFVLSQKRQDGTKGGSGFTLREIPERRFAFSQPLFSGFKEFAAMASSVAEKRRRSHEKRRAEELLFVDVVDAFYFFLRYQDDAETLSVIHQSLLERVKELKERQELGRSRASEVAALKARLNRIEADLEQTQGEGDLARQLLEFLTGREIAAVRDDTPAAISLFLEENYLAQKDQRSDVQAAFEAVRQAQKNLTVARAGFFPEVTMDGNSYEKRVGNSAGVDWDVTLTVDVPIFEGTEHFGAIKEAKAIAGQEELRYQQLKRQVELEIKNAYTRAQVALRKQTALRKALQAAEENYNLQLEDYRKNLVNNLDVLQALEDLEEMRRSLTAAQNETKRLWWNLQVISGRLDVPFGETLGTGGNVNR